MVTEDCCFIHTVYSYMHTYTYRESKFWGVWRHYRENLGGGLNGQKICQHWVLKIWGLKAAESPTACLNLHNRKFHHCCPRAEYGRFCGPRARCKWSKLDCGIASQKPNFAIFLIFIDFQAWDEQFRINYPFLKFVNSTV